MNWTVLRTTLPVLVITTLFGVVAAQKKPLTHDVYDGWKSVSGTKLSNDGAWIAFAITPQQGDNVVHVKSTGGSTEYTFDRSSNFRFSNDSKFLVATIVPKFLEARDATRKKVKAVDKPKNGLLILNLETGEKTEMERITSYTMAEEDLGWFVYRPEKPKPEPKEEDQKDGGLDQEKKEEQEEDEEEKKKKGHDDGYTIVARNLASGEEVEFENVSSYTFNKDGSRLYYAYSPKELEGHGVFAHDFSDGGTKVPIIEGLGKYVRISLDEEGDNVAILTDKDDYRTEKPSHSIYVYSVASGKTKLVAKEGMDGIDEGWWVPSNSTMRWNKDSSRLIFGLAPKPEEEKEDDEKEPEDEKVSVDVWSWNDIELQPQQLLRLNSERNRQYDAILDMGRDSVVRIETREMKNVSLPRDGNGDYGLAVVPITVGAGGTPDDIYLVDLATGDARGLFTDFMGNVRWSPTGRWLVVFDSSDKRSSVMDPRTKRKIDVSSRVPYPIYNYEDDHPSGGGSYGIAGWSEDDGTMYVYDKFDIWAVDLTSSDDARCVTEEYGRRRDIRLRYLRLDREEEFLDGSKPAMLRAFDNRFKDAGFMSDTFDGRALPEELMMDAAYFTGPTKARDADKVFFTRETFVEYRDVWVANVRFENARKFSEANPQQSDYRWGTTELVDWVSLDGARLQGIVYRPDDMDFSKKYPMVTYFYEKSSQNLHRYRTPSPSASTINVSYFVSNGYVVFVPDIPYKIGYPGESAVSAVVSGVNRVLADGYVDPGRLGIQGQSWGGYQVAYLVTETDMFAAAGAGAPVSNMFSAYGGIRWGSGLVRQLQYETGQSRLGGSMWEVPMRYWENSPVFFADKVKTPLLIMHNDKDGAVPWWQGIELFTALHRLKKPSWLLVYNGESHNLRQRKNRKDLSVRLSQFFDHYLKGAAMPVWMADGIPAVMKGKTYGFELVDGGGSD